MLARYNNPAEATGTDGCKPMKDQQDLSRRKFVKGAAATGVAATGVGAFGGQAAAQNVDVDASQLFSDSLIVVNLNNVDILNNVDVDALVNLQNIDVDVTVQNIEVTGVEGDVIRELEITVQNVDVSVIDRSVVNVLVTVLGESAISGQDIQVSGTDQLQV